MHFPIWKGIQVVDTGYDDERPVRDYCEQDNVGVAVAGRLLLWDVLYDRQRRVRGFVSFSSRFPFVYVLTYTNGNLDANKTKPRTQRCRSYSWAARS